MDAPSLRLRWAVKRRLPGLLGFLMGWLLIPSWANAEAVRYVLIANSETAIADISKEALNNLFLGKIDSIPGMGKVAPIHAYHKSEAYRAFVYGIHDSTLGKMKQYWARRVIKGLGSPPRSFRYYEEIIQYIERNRGTLSYIPKKLVNPDIKVLTIEGKPYFVDPML